MNEKSFYTHYLQIEIIMKNVKPFSQYLQISEWDYSASCLWIINNISPSRDVGQKHILLHHTTGNVSWDAMVSVLFMGSMCVRENREGGGSEIQFTDKMESQHRCQKWKIVSIDNWKKFALLGSDNSPSLPLCYSWHARSLAGEVLHLNTVYWEFSFFWCLESLQHNRLELQEE